MRWTTTKPSKPGWYWWRWNHGTPRLVQLLCAKGDDTLVRMDERGYISELDVGSLCEWSGPLEIPQES